MSRDGPDDWIVRFILMLAFCFVLMYVPAWVVSVIL